MPVPVRAQLVTFRCSSYPDVTPSAWIQFVRASWKRLERLDLSSVSVTDDVLETLADNPAMTQLRVLHLGTATTTDRTARAILDSPHLRKLQRLRLPAHHLDAPLLRRLRDAFGAGFNPGG